MDKALDHALTAGSSGTVPVHHTVQTPLMPRASRQQPSMHSPAWAEPSPTGGAEGNRRGIAGAFYGGG